MSQNLDERALESDIPNISPQIREQRQADRENPPIIFEYQERDRERFYHEHRCEDSENIYWLINYLVKKLYWCIFLLNSTLSCGF